MSSMIHRQPIPEVDVMDVLAARVASGQPLVVILPGQPQAQAEPAEDPSLIRNGEQFRRGAYGITSPRSNPLCEECDLEMSPFAGPCDGDGKTIVEGWSCIGCGWSIDQS